MPSSTASVNSCRISLPRPAPKAARKPSSFARTVPRARCRLEIFTQAMSRTKVTAASRTRNAGRTGPTSSLYKGTTRMPSSLSSTYDFASPAAITFISSCAWRMDMPAFTRPTTL